MTARDDDVKARAERLLDARRREQPGDAGRARALAALEQGALPAPEFADGPPLRRGRWAVAGGGLLVVALLTAGGWRLGAARSTEPGVARPTPAPRADDAPPPRPAPLAVAPVTLVEAPASPAPESADAGPALVAVPVTPRPKPRILPPSSPEEDPLARELAMLDQSRRELKLSPAAALRTLERYEREFPRGELLREARLVRLEVLLALGRRAEAEAAAARLVAADPNGPVARRVRKLLAGEP